MKLSNANCPKHLKEDLFEIDFHLDNEKKKRVWDKLQKRETFIKGQIPPYRVEFETGLCEGDFREGEKNIHHGPFLSVHGEIGKISEEYRGLYYYYGSYVLSFRLIRPVLLEFYKTKTGIKMKLHSYVHPYFHSIWRFGNNIFWKRFGISFLF
jgi:hypothetical protein